MNQGLTAGAEKQEPPGPIASACHDITNSENELDNTIQILFRKLRVILPNDVSPEIETPQPTALGQIEKTPFSPSPFLNGLNSHHRQMGRMIRNVRMLIDAIQL